MIFFAFLFILIAYLAIALFFSKKVYRYLEKRGKGRLVASVAAGLIVFLAIAVVFWDAWPTWYTHRRLCHTEFGLKVYMTPEEWAKNNPERFAQIRPAPKPSVWEKIKTPRVETSIEHLNSEFDQVTEHEKDYGFGVMRNRYRLIDSRTKQVLTESVDFYGGVTGGSIATGTKSLADYKFWLTTLGCGFAYPDLRAKYDKDIKEVGEIFSTIQDWGKK